MKQIFSATTAVWLGIYILMVCICRSAGSYHFYYMEQWQTFYWDADALKSALLTQGALGTWMVDFLVQFFYYGAAPFIYGFLMWLVAYGLSCIPNHRLPYLGILPAMAMLLVQVADMQCSLSYSISLALAMSMLAVAFWFKKPFLRLVAVIASLALFLWIFGTQGFYRPGSEVTLKAYLPWILSLVIVLIKVLLAYLPAAWMGKNSSWCKKPWIGIAAQLLVAVAGSAAMFVSLYHAQDEYMKKIYYYVRHQQWDEIINRSNSLGSKGNVTFQLCRNMALAEKGELGEKFLMYEQQGMNSIMTSDFKTLQVSMLMMDVYYAMGYVNMSQLCAFEAQECMDNKSPYLWQRLVDTNIANGAYAVAEKYIKRLEQTLAYSQWARQRRRFLYNDRAVMADRELGMMRKCIYHKDRLMGDGGFDNDLASIIAACPEHRASLQYLGAMYIVANQRAQFLQLMKRYEGTKAMPEIPASFAKAREVFLQQSNF